MRKSNYSFKVWQNENNKKWYWNAKGKNGEILGSAHQGFASKQSAERNAKLNGFEY